MRYLAMTIGLAIATAGYAQCPTCQPAVPQVVMMPQTTWAPYEYQGTQVYQRYYHTPVRNWLFGRYRVRHIYRPYQQRPAQPMPEMTPQPLPAPNQ